MLRILPYNRFSKSAKSIVQTVGKRNIRKKLPYNQPKRSDIIINWGCSNIEFDYNRNIIFNKPEAIKVASNKKLALEKLKEEGICVPDFTCDVNQVKRWLEDGFRVLCRHKLRSHSGQGIQVLQPEDINNIPYSPLYVKYHKKKYEFRVHVFNGEVIDYVAKKKRLNTESYEGVNNLIRSHDNGWVFCRSDILVLDSVKELAVQSVDALELDFGAVDIIIHKDKPMTLEVNTAPGVEGTTLEKYAEAIRNLQGI